MLKRFINGMLSPFGIRISRCKTIDVLRTENNVLLQQCDALTQGINVSNAKNNALSQQIIEKQAAYDALLHKNEQQANQHKTLLEYMMYARWHLLDRIEEQHPYPKRMACPLCGGQLPADLKEYRTECIFQGGALLRYQCPHCDVIFGPEKMLRLSPGDLREEYRWHYTFCNEGSSLEKEKKAFFDLSPRKDRIYLNYGGGRWSQSTHALRSEGWQVYNYEPYANPDEDFVIRSKEQLASMKFDGLFSQDLMEHLMDPIGEMVFMKSILNPGAKMNHVTGCWEYLYEYTRFHLFFFLGRSRELLAARAGLKYAGYQAIPEQDYRSCIFITPSEEYLSNAGVCESNTESKQA